MSSARYASDTEPSCADGFLRFKNERSAFSACSGDIGSDLLERTKSSSIGQKIRVAPVVH